MHSINIQVEKSLEMKKCSRNGTAKIKKTRYRKVYNVNSHTSMLDGFYLTTQYQGECGHIDGHAYAVGVATSRTLTQPFPFFGNT